MSGQMPAQSRAPVTLRSLGMTAPTMGGMPHHMQGFKPPEHAWKPAAPAAPAPNKKALADALSDKHRRFIEEDMRRYENHMAGIGAP